MLLLLNSLSGSRNIEIIKTLHKNHKINKTYYVKKKSPSIHEYASTDFFLGIIFPALNMFNNVKGCGWDANLLQSTVFYLVIKVWVRLCI